MARTIVFDANGTLFDLAPVRALLGGEDRLEAFFQRTLHSAAALTLAGAWAPFDEVAAAALATTCAQLQLDVDQRRVREAMHELPPAPDVREAVDAAGACAILTNGGAGPTRTLVERGGLGIETILSCEEVRAYKPAAAAYRLARDRLGDCVLVAAHAWDVAGARAAGLPAVWVDRHEREWPLAGVEPGARAATLVGAVEQARSA
jgi:2-haloacid dehalogenase